MKDQWYCRVFVTEMGPLSWDELRGMAERGTLSPGQRVRREGETEWHEARAIEGLIPAPAHDETDFEVAPKKPPAPAKATTPAPAKPQPSTSAKPQPAAPAKKESLADDSDFDIGPPFSAQPEKKPAAAPKRPVESPTSAAADSDFDIGPPYSATPEKKPIATPKPPSKPNDDADFDMGPPPPPRKAPDRPTGK